MQRSGSEQERVIYYGQSDNPLLQSKLEIDQIGSHRSSRCHVVLVEPLCGDAKVLWS